MGVNFISAKLDVFNFLNIEQHETNGKQMWSPMLYGLLQLAKWCKQWAMIAFQSTSYYQQLTRFTEKYWIPQQGNANARRGDL